MLDNAKLPYNVWLPCSKNTLVYLGAASALSGAIKRWGLPPKNSPSAEQQNAPQDKKGFSYDNAVFYTNLATVAISTASKAMLYRNNLDQDKYASLIPKFTIMLGSGYKWYLLYNKCKNEENVNTLMSISGATDIVQTAAQYLLCEDMITCKLEKKNPSSIIKNFALYTGLIHKAVTNINLINNVSSTPHMCFAVLHLLTDVCGYYMGHTSLT